MRLQRTVVETVSEPKDGATKGLAALTTAQREQAMARFAVLRRILDVNRMDVVTKDVVEAARGSLIIGPP